MKNPLNYVLSTLLCLPTLLSLNCSATIQPAESDYYTINLHTPQDLQKLFTPDSEQLPLLSAHRGGAGTGFPENCLATFEATIRQSWSMLEIDLRYTRDSILILNHDPTLDRTTNGTGPVLDYTLEELRKLRLKDRAGALTDHQIPTLDETIEWARGKTILVLDKKDVPVRNAVRKIEEHQAEPWVMIMASSYKDITECYALNPNIMMEVMVGSDDRFNGFDSTGVPWRNIIAFVGHTQTPDADLCRRIRARGASTMAGSSRNIDRQYLDRRVAGMSVLKPDYLALLGIGVDIIETDIPREVGPLLYGRSFIPSSKNKFFRAGRP